MMMWLPAVVPEIGKWVSDNKAWLFDGAGVVAVTTAGGLLVLLWRRLRKAPSPLTIPIGPGTDFVPDPRSIRIRYAKKTDIAAISELANHFLGQGHGISAELAGSWYQKNNHIFRVVECTMSPPIRGSRWVFCGYYSLVPLTDTTYDHLKAGQLHDYQVQASSISAFSNPNVHAIYIMDLMTADGRCLERGCASQVGAHLMRDLIWNVTQLLHTAPHVNEISSVAATDVGKKLLRKAGFSRLSSYRNPFGWEFWHLDPHGQGVSRAARMLLVPASGRFQHTYIVGGG